MTGETIRAYPATSMRATVPEHVVFRAFPSETVMLNLNSGTYHGLNKTAGRMLEELERSPTIALAAARLAVEFEQPIEAVEHDICELCRSLSERDLIRVE